MVLVVYQEFIEAEADQPVGRKRFSLHYNNAPGETSAASKRVFVMGKWSVLWLQVSVALLNIAQDIRENRRHNAPEAANLCVCARRFPQ